MNRFIGNYLAVLVRPIEAVCGACCRIMMRGEKATSSRPAQKNHLEYFFARRRPGLGEAAPGPEGTIPLSMGEAKRLRHSDKQTAKICDRLLGLLRGRVSTLKYN